MLATTAALRRGPARDHLVYGRMLRPATVDGVEVIRWQFRGADHEIKAVFDGAWRAPDGRSGVVLANWTNSEQTVTVTDPRLGAQVTQHTSDGEVRSVDRQVDGPLVVLLPHLSCVLLEEVR